MVENLAALVAATVVLVLIVVLTSDALWAEFASSACSWLGRVGNLHNKITGSFLLAAGAALAVSRRNA